MNFLQKKKLAFMSIVNRVKGFVRNVLGAPPLVLPDCVDEEALINYTMDGNSVQNGTPTPEAPVEVESVGVKTDNLLSGIEKATNSLSTYTIEDNTLTITPTSLKAYQSYVSIKLRELELGKTYTVSWNIDFNASSGAKPFTRVGYYGASNKWNDIKTRTAATSGRYNITFTLPETMPDDINSYGFCMLFNYTNVVATELSDCKIYDIMLVEGNESADYEPYGYKIPVVCGQLLDSIKYKKGYFINASGVESASGGYWCTEDYIPVLPNTTYRIVCENGDTTYEYYLTIPFYDSNKNFISRISLGAFAEVPKVAEFTTPNDCYYIRFSLPNKDYDVSLYNLDNTTNIYLDEPLRKLSILYADTIDFENQKVIRKVWRDYITKVDSISANLTTYKVFMSDISYKPVMTDSVMRVFILTNKFTQPTESINYSLLSRYPNSCLSYVTSGGANRVAYTFDDKAITTKEQALEALGDGFEANYVLATPIEEQITLPKLPTIKGTTVYTIDTSIQPTNMSATYYATSKED